MEPGRTPDDDPLEKVVNLAAKLGLNPVRVRWKLMAWRKRWEDLRLRRERKGEHLAFKHHICPTCGGLADEGARACPKCGGKLRSRPGEIFHRLGFSAVAPTTATLLLGVAIVVAYARVVIASPGEGILSFSVKSLVLHGGNHPASVFAGQYWRLATALFLHVGAWHLLFNLMALAQVGPMVTDVFGSGRMLAYFLLTGIAANATSVLFGHYAVQAGASGAIMGLVGIAVGWGTRDGTSVGKNVRTQMIRWALYTFLFGAFMGADNIAHGAGFVLGAILGYAAKPGWLRAKGSSPVLGLVAAAVVIASAALIFIAPKPVMARRHAAALPPLPSFQAPTDMASATRLIADLTGAAPVGHRTPEDEITPIRLFSVDRRKGAQVFASTAFPLRRAGTFLFQYDKGFGDHPITLGLAPTTDPYQVIRWVGSDGANVGKSTEDILVFLRALAARYPFELTGAGIDFVEIVLHTPPRGPAAQALADELYAFCPDIVDQGTQTVAALADAIAEDGVIFLWWD